MSMNQLFDAFCGIFHTSISRKLALHSGYFCDRQGSFERFLKTLSKQYTEGLYALIASLRDVFI